jgi:hypothetical protein
VVKVLVIAGIVVVVLIVLLVVLVVVSSRNSSQGLSMATGTLRDLEFYTSHLQEANNSRAFLIVTLDGSPDFLQMKYVDGEFELDFPLVTDRQKSLEEKIRRLYEEHDYKIVENPSTSGHTFLDVYFNSRAILVETASEVFREVFGATAESSIKFQWSDMVVE